MTKVEGEPRKARNFTKGICLVSLAGVLLFVALFWVLKGNGAYTTESRTVSRPGGEVAYVLRTTQAAWPIPESIRAIRRHSLARIYHSVYYNGVGFYFSTSGKVFALRGEESGEFTMLRGWGWSGDPRDFPSYDYAHSVVSSGP